MKYKNIDLNGLDIEIDIEAAKSYIEHRALKKKPLTQRAFNQAMQKALLGFTIKMTPTEVIDYTVDKGWDGINLNYIVNARNNECTPLQTYNQPNVVAIGGRKTRDIGIDEQLSDRSWAE